MSSTNSDGFVHGWPYWPRMSKKTIAVRTGTCPHCGYWNHQDAQVRDAGDTKMFCNNCGEMFEAE